MREPSRIGIGRPCTIAVVGLALALSACAQGKPFTYDRPDEMPSGCGLFTGPSGSFTIYRENADGTTEVMK